VIKFLDMDGVIIDSIEECYSVSKDAYYESKSFIYSEDRYKKIFFKYRGHVRPPYEYFCLHDAIEHFYDKQFDDLQFINFFNNNSKKFQYDDKAAFEETFFTIRLDHQNNDFDSWIKMNPLTSFGETLKSKNNANTYVITTKNMQAAKKILNFYKIGVDKIYSNDEVRDAGTKGKLIKEIMDASNESDAIFIDDSVEHLDTVDDDRVTCYFADWGYGKNTDYPTYSFVKC
tara:strand:+ start:9756 stop:10445 length:690 start_codon:yes stop_codon:yes gene_type:complete